MPTAQQYLSYLQLPTVKAFLDTIAWAEGGTYNKLFGGGTFSGNQHPNRAISAGSYTSTAAGRYQFLYSTWQGIKRKLGLSDFSPVNQDIAALELISQRGELQKVINGQLESALRGLGCAWAALPFSGCGQSERTLAQVASYYNNALRIYNNNQGGNAVILQTNQVLPALNNTVNNTLPNINSNQKQDYTVYYILGALGLVLILKS